MYGIEYFSDVLKKTVLGLTSEVSLGRSSCNTLRICEPGVSRFHAKITPMNGKWILRDLGSKNGILVNGKHVKSHVLSPGDCIVMGSARLRFIELGRPLAQSLETNLLASTRSMDPSEPFGEEKEREISHQMGLVRTFLEAVKVGVAIVSPEMQALYYNSGLEHPGTSDLKAPASIGVVLACPSAGQRGCDPGSCVQCPLYGFVKESFNRQCSLGPMEAPWPPAKTPLRFLRFWITPLPYFLMGDPLCLLTWEDVTQERNIEIKLEELNRDLEDANRQLTQAIERANVLAFEAQAANIAKSAFLARMSHEIRTPLNSVLGYTQMLLEEDLKEEQKAHVRMVNTSGQALLALIEDILDFSKIEAGEMSLECVSFSLRETLQEACEIVRPKLQDKPVKLSWEAAADVPELLLGDPVRTRQVILNLLGNAAKFTKKGEISLKVEKTHKEGSRIQLLFTVKDTGIGIPQHKLQIIFEPFRQAEDSTGRLYGGTGLGLTICRQLARLMQGEIWATSKEGAGSTFYFKAWFQECTQPPVQECIPEDTKAAPAQDLLSEPPPPAMTPPSRPARILLVEDNPVNAQLAELMLTKAGHMVQTAKDGWEALKLFTAKSRELDLILMDVEMPGLDGLRATKRIRALGHLDVPIVAMTAHALKEDMERCLESGMNDYLSKPIRKEILLNMVDKWTSKKRT